VWSRQNLLALCGADHFLTISNAEGDTLYQLPVHGDLTDVQFSEVKSDEHRSMGENAVSFQAAIFVLKVFSLS